MATNGTRPLSIKEIETIRRCANLTSKERRALATIDTLLGELAVVKKASLPLGVAETGRTKVLVTVAYDGFVEVFAEEGVDVRLVELWPWDDEELVALPEAYRSIHFPGNCRAIGLPRLRVRPEFETILRAYAAQEARIELIEALRERIGKP